MKWMQSLKLVLLCFSAVLPVAALGQAQPATQRLDLHDECAGLDRSVQASCGMDAFRDGNYLVARRAWGMAAADGDYVAADWLAGLYEDGNGVKIDYVLAYKWYDIAATLHAHSIARMPASESIDQRENNQQEINYRDAIGQKLSSRQMEEAVSQSKQWQAFYLH
jgi:TPR repeat protein